jgi:hypothetical protein
MLRQLSLLAVAWTLAIPTFADTQKPDTPVKTQNGRSDRYVNKVNLKMGQGVPVDKVPGSGAPKAQKIVSVPKVTPNSNPCKGPNPPRSCKQVRPPH